MNLEEEGDGTVGVMAGARQGGTREVPLSMLSTDELETRIVERLDFRNILAPV